MSHVHDLFQYLSELPNALGALALLACLAAYLFRDARHLKTASALGSMLWAGQSLALGAYGAGAVFFLMAARQLTAVRSETLSRSARAQFTALYCGLGLALFAWQQPTLVETLVLLDFLLGTWGYFFLANVALRQLLLGTSMLYGLYGLGMGAETLVIKSAVKPRPSGRGYKARVSQHLRIVIY